MKRWYIPLLATILAAVIGVAVIGQEERTPVPPDRLFPIESPPAEPKLTDEDLARLKREAQVRRDEMFKSARTYTLSGPDTIGSVIMIRDREVQLPPDVYVVALLMSGLCVEGRKCPEMPLYVLGYIGTEDRISVTMRTGEIHNQMPSPEDDSRVREKFRWLEEAAR